MNNEVDWAYFKAVDLGEVGKARYIKLESNGKRHYVPRSISDWHRPGILVIEEWWAKKEGIGE